MLDSFYVSNFRLFEQLKIEKLSRVNLIVGKNNSGKSAVLEAIRIYASNANPYLMFELVTSRQEFSDTNGSRTSSFPKSTAFALRHLFKGHKLPEHGKSGIELGPLKPKNKRFSLIIDMQKDDKSALAAPLPILVRKSANKKTIIIRLDHELDKRRDWDYFQNLQDFIGKDNIAARFVGSQIFELREIAELWDRIALNDLKNEVIAGMNLVEPGIKDLHFMQSHRISDLWNFVPMVKTDKSPDPIPLRSMGDGTFRIFHLILVLVNARDGILLVDEFENGLHWSVQPKTWEIVFRLAEKLNVQVFATTHSRDCIAGFEAAWKSNITLGAFYRLETIQDQVTITSYDCETLSDSLETDVEVR